MVGLLYMWMCEMDIATWFLMLISNMTMAKEGLEEAVRMMSLRFLIWILTLFSYRWKENLLEKKSIRQFPGENSWLNKSKEERNSFFLLSMSMRRLPKWSLCLDVRVLRDRL